MKVALLILLFFIFVPQLYCADIGSDITVDRFTVKQTLFDGDRIAGFASLEAGLRLNNIVTNGTFDSFFPVSGVLELNGGTLNLMRDLVLSNNAIIGMFGEIIGNNYALDLAESTTCIIDISGARLKAEIFFITETTPPDVDNVESVDWSFDSRFLAAGTDDLGNNGDIFLVYEFINNTLIFRDSDITGVSGGDIGQVEDVRWHPFSYLIAVALHEDTSTDELNIYSFDPNAGTLSLEDSQVFSDSVNAAAWHKSGDYLAIGTEVNASEIIIYPVSSAGILNTGSALFFDITSNQDVSCQALDWDSTGSYLAVGLVSNGGDHELRIYEFNDQPALSLTLNASLLIGQTVAGLDWNKTFSNILAVGLVGSSGNLVRLYEHDRAGGAVGEIFGVTGIGATVEGISWHPEGEVLAIGRDTTGGIGKLQTYFYNSGEQTLELVSDINTGDDVEAVRWAPNGVYLASGDDDNILSAYGLPKNLGFNFEDLKVYLGCDTVLKNADIIFRGNSVLDGRGFALTIEPSASITIDPEATLSIRDIAIKGLRKNNIKCLDNLSAISFENVHCILDDDYSFTVGRFSVKKEFCISGSGKTFSYQANQESTIESNSILCLDYNLTFSYDPSSENRDLIKLVDDTAKLFLRGATLHSTATGLRFTKGILEIDDNTYFSSEATVPFEGIMLGDGFSSENNVKIKWLADSGLNILRGFVQYKNSES